MEFNEDQKFEDYLSEIKQLSEELGVTMAYIEAEFIIDGELIRM